MKNYVPPGGEEYGQGGQSGDYSMPDDIYKLFHTRSAQSSKSEQTEITVLLPPEKNGDTLIIRLLFLT
ncbi:MAG: hypothetical protein QX199_04395 [Methylococcaceae bacterium]